MKEIVEIHARQIAATLDFSPCHSSNQKYVKNKDPYNNNSTAIKEPEGQEEEEQGRFNSSSEKKTIKKRHSFGAALNLGPLLDDCPPSPSPICSPVNCSPVSCISCSPPTELYFSQFSTDFSNEMVPTRNQSSCIESQSSKEEKKKEETSKASNSLPQPKFQSYPLTLSKIRVDNEDGGGKHENRSKPKSMRTIRRQFIWEAEISTSVDSATSDSKLEEQVREIMLPVVNGEKEEHGSIAQLGLSAVSHEIQISPDTGYEASNGSRFESSDIESGMGLSSWIRSDSRLSRILIDDMKRKDPNKELLAWKEAQALKLMNKLRRKEAAIAAWERKEKIRAKWDFKRTEKKLEKKRLEAMEKMKKGISKARRKADGKKLQERATTLKKISRLSEVVEKIKLAGKSSWKLLCF